MVAENLTTQAEGDVDRIIHKRFFAGRDSGRVFVDVGAARPDYLSISALFRSLGWRIIAIEPNPAFCELHKKKGYEVLQYACGDSDEDNVDFMVVDSHGDEYEKGQVSYESFSSLGIKDSYQALKKDLDTKTIKVNLRRLDTILETHAPEINHIDILSVDVEGWELEVLGGLSIEKYKPQVMVIENLLNEKKYREYMKAISYILWRYIPPNDVYIRKDQLKGIAKYFSSLYALVKARWSGTVK